MTTPDLQALIELSEKATQGVIAKVSVERILDFKIKWKAAYRVSGFPEISGHEDGPFLQHKADAKFIAALVNWFRANHSTLTAPTLPGAGGGEWLPIESAPKDGTNVLLLIKWSEIPLIGHFSHNRWWGDTEHYETSCSSYCYGGSPSTATGTEPTHWQPLPAALPPQQGG